MRTTNHTKYWIAPTLLALAAFFAFVPLANAQRGASLDGHPIPTPRYYRGVQLLQMGNYSAAVNFYQQELKSAFRIGNQLWIDSICYYAMIGESYYQAGDLNNALTNYNAALTIAMDFPSWMGRVNFATGVSTHPKAPAPWGQSRRISPIGSFPTKATITIGDKITEERLKQGGLISEQKAIPIDPIEILRCTSLCIRRRLEILGPLAPFDPMSQQVLDAFQKRAVAPNHWSITLLDVIWGFALAESDKTSSAIKTLSQSLVMAGTYDHTLTGAALFELGNLYLKAAKVREAAQCYYEASVSAWQFGDYLLLEEALRNYSNASKALRRNGNDPVINMAFRWAKTQKNCQALIASLGLELVEEFIDQGKLNLATSGLGAVDKTMRATSGGGLRTSRAADRWNYLNALLFYSNADIPAGDASLAKVVEGCKLRSPWALQLIRLDNYVKNGLSSNGALTPRNAADLYEYLLREPTVVDWAVRPTESLAIQMIAPADAYERWFSILIDRDLKDKAFEVAERVRRERFFRTQTYGGRLLSLRYILTVDDALTTASLRNARQALLFEFPEFAALAQESKAITNELNSLPTVPTEKTLISRQASLFEQLANVSIKQEAIMRFVAAGRVRIPYVFPPVYSVKDVQKRMPPDTAILSFIDAEGQTFGFMIGKDNLDAWRIGSTNKVAAAVGQFLKTIGNTEGTRQIEASALAEAHWKAQGAKLREIVLGAQDVDADRFNIMFSKLVVVPDGALWYLPFEALCLPAMASTEMDVEEEEQQQNVAQNNEEAISEEEDDLDSAYTATEDEALEINQANENVETIDEEEIADAQENTLENADQATETNVAQEPVKRKSRSTRQREELEAYEASLIPMIQASELTIRYSATVGLSLPNALGRNAFVETTIAGGTTYPKESVETLEAAVERFSAAVNKTEAFHVGSIELPGMLYASRLRRLVVFDEILGNVWNWEPFTPGKSRSGNRAADWIACPWGAPRLFVAPALRTHAEDALKNGGDGSELFLPILAMQASGADSMLLSRWRTGGRSAYDLTTDFVKNYNSLPTAEAYKLAALKLMKREVVVDEEPRLRKLGRSEAIPTYESPFWWAGYMLIDSGEAIQADELERLDEENVKKAQEEEALLEGNDGEEGQKEPNESQSQRNLNSEKTTGSNEQVEESNVDTKNNSTEGEDEEGVIIPSFVNPSKSNADKSDSSQPLDLGPATIDDVLAEQDEAGEDFFANEEEEGDDPTSEENGNEEDQEANESDSKEEDAEEEEPELPIDDEEVKESDDEATEEKAEKPKPSVKPTKKSGDQKSGPKSKSGTVSLKPKK